MLGIEPTQREEQRRKKWLRLFVEERMVEMGFVFASLGYLVCDMIDSLYRFGIATKKFAVDHKAYAGIILFAILVFSAMLL
jgi:hypothetical protein